MSISYLREITDQYFRDLENNLNDSEIDTPSNESAWKSLLFETMDAYNDLVFIIDNDGNIIETNKAGKSVISSLPSNFSCNPKTLKINNNRYKLSSISLDNNKSACIARLI